MEILFKAKRIDTGEWIEGNYICKNDPLLDVEYSFIVAQGKGESFVTWHKVDPNTVCQYTLKTDRNGNKVFNSDILYDPHENERYVVFWDVESAGYVLKKDWICRSIERVYYCEVIGNIFDKE